MKRVFYVDLSTGRRTLVIPDDITALESARLAACLAMGVASNAPAADEIWEFIVENGIERLFQ